MTSLNALFNPQNVAIIGATANPGKPGHTLMQNIIGYGFQGEVYPVNPGGGEILGKKAFRSLADVEKQVDLALIIVPAPAVAGVVRECARAGVKTAVILSSGFGEAGASGLQYQADAIAAARLGGVRLVGPNCLGIFNLTDNFNGTIFGKLPHTKGNISFISQSGAMGGLFFNEASCRHFGLAKFISLGNMADIDYVDLLEYLAEDEATEVITLFLEGLRDGRRFLKTAAAITPHKPIIVLKAGRTDAGRRAVGSHTGSLAGETEIYRTAFKQAGIIWASGTEDLFDKAMSLAMSKKFLPTGSNMAVVTISGGPSVLASDLCEEQGLQVRELNSSTQKRVRQLIPEFAAAANPVDMTPQCAPENYEACLEAIAGDSEVDGLIAINVGLDNPEFARAFIKIRELYQKPVVAFVALTPKISKIFKNHFIPEFPSVERAINGLMGLISYREVLKHGFNEFADSGVASAFLSQRNSSECVLNEFESKNLFQEYGITCTREKTVMNLEEAKAAAEEIGYPVAIKVCQSDIVHKTDVGGVELKLKNCHQLTEALERLNSRGLKPPYLVQEMVFGQAEIFIGGKNDPVFGPVLVFGVGGIMAELIHKVTLCMVPINRTRALQMVVESPVYPFLSGFRNRPVGNLSKIVDLLCQVSNLLTGNPQIQELDINPLVLAGDQIIALDGLVVLK